MKKVTGKIVACVAAIAVMAGILCSCAPLYNRVGAVSYTHLDVYKRQVPGNGASG